MRGFLIALRVLTCVVVFPAAVFAQGSAFGGGTIAGTAKDTSGAVLPGVTVEAASPVLIEKIRTAVTDSSGLYKIVDLRPGLYTVTFTLPGFNSYRRGGVELEGTAVITVNAELKVGAIEETVIVTGETPVVDLQTTTRERVLSKEVIDSLPTSRLYYSLGVLVPGVSASSRDVGGASGSLFQTTLTAHGSSGNDQRIMINGMNLGAINVGNISNVVPNTGAAQEVQIDTAAAAAERQTGGVVVNFLPKDGGNTFRGSVFATGATENMQASNFTQDLTDLGATASPSKFKETWDFNPGFGGPILKDKVWFYYTYRGQGAKNKTDMFYNQNEFVPSAWTYVANTNRPALSQHGSWADNNLRLTWQVNARNKVAGTFSDQVKCSCPNGVSATQSPEAALDQRNPVQRTLQAEWWSPLTNKVLLEFVAQARSVRFMNRDLQPTANGGSLVVTPQQYALYPSLIGVTQTNGGGILPNGLSFHGPNTTSDTNYRPAYSYRASASYITGSHAFKVGMQDTFGYNSVETYIVTRDTQDRPVRYRFASANTPDQVTVYNTPTFTRNDQNHDFGLFAQDRWTRERLTLNLGVRYDWYASSYPTQILPASTNGRPETQFAAGDNLSWKDVTPRMGAAYDLRGDGKTAVKISLNKYVANQALGGLGISANPLSAGNGIVANWSRNWTDANGDKVVDCNVNQQTANGECTNAIAASVFNVTPNPRLDQEVRNGWNLRGYNWEFSAGVQRELMPRVSIDVSFFRRWFGNFTATDNTACVNAAAQTGCVVPGNYKSFDIVAPADSRLPGGGANVLRGYVDPDCTGPQANCGAGTAAQIAALTALNKTVLADSIGASQTDHWNGVDVNLSARLQNGLLIQGGTGTGRRSTNDCQVSALLPETLGNNPQSFCDNTEPWLTQVKLLAAYTLPRYSALPALLGAILKDVQAGATFQSIPGAAMTANYAMTNAEFATACPSAIADPSCSTLGRFISNQTLATNTRNVSLITPGTTYDERQNQLDLRVGRILRYRQTRTSLNFDIFNVTNTNTILGRNNTFAKSNTAGNYAAAQAQQADGKFHTVWVPTSVLQARFYKLSVNFDF